MKYIITVNRPELLDEANLARFVDFYRGGKPHKFSSWQIAERIAADLNQKFPGVGARVKQADTAHSPLAFTLAQGERMEDTGVL